MKKSILTLILLSFTLSACFSDNAKQSETQENKTHNSTQTSQDEELKFLPLSKNLLKVSSY